MILNDLDLTLWALITVNVKCIICWASMTSGERAEEIRKASSLEFLEQ